MNFLKTLYKNGFQLRRTYIGRKFFFARSTGDLFGASPVDLATAVPDMNFLVTLQDPGDAVMFSWAKCVRNKNTGRGRKGKDCVASTFDGLIDYFFDVTATGNVEIRAKNKKQLQKTTFFTNHFYADHLAKWLAWFDIRQLMIVFLKDLFTHPYSTMNRITMFAGLNRLDYMKHSSKKNMDKWGWDSEWTVATGGGTEDERLQMSRKSRYILDAYFQPQRKKLKTILLDAFGFSTDDLPHWVVASDEPVPRPKKERANEPAKLRDGLEDHPPIYIRRRL